MTKTTTPDDWRPPSKPRWTKRDGEAMLAALEASGQTDSAFAREHGIGVHRISYWRGQRVVSRSAKQSFVAVEVTDEVSATEGRRVEVAVGSRLRLTFTGDWSADALRPWMRALEGDRC